MCGGGLTGGSIETTTDAFLGGKVEVMQAKVGPRAGTDSVLLASYIPALSGERVLEAGTGSGVVSLCLGARISGLSLTGVEVLPGMVQIARGNATRNSLNFSVIEGDVTASGNHWKSIGLVPDCFDHSFANPPFYETHQARVPKDPVRAQGHVHPEDALERWVRFLICHTRPKGSITLVHTPDVLGKLLGYFDRRVGSIKIFPIYSKKGQSANRILVQGIKSSRGPLQIEPGLIMHDETGAFTAKASSILRDGMALIE